MSDTMEGKAQKGFDRKKNHYEDPCHKAFHHLDTNKLMDWFINQDPCISTTRFIRYAKFLMDRSAGDMNRWQFHSRSTLSKLQNSSREEFLITSYRKLEKHWMEEGLVSKVAQQKSSGADAPSFRRLGPRFDVFRPGCIATNAIMSHYAKLERVAKLASADYAPLSAGMNSMPPPDRPFEAGIRGGSPRGSVVDPLSKTAIDHQSLDNQPAPLSARIHGGSGGGIHGGSPNPMNSNPVILNPVIGDSSSQRSTASAATLDDKVNRFASFRSEMAENKNPPQRPIEQEIGTMLRTAKLLGLALDSARLEATVDFCLQSLKAEFSMIREQWTICIVHIVETKPTDPYQTIRNWMDKELQKLKKRERSLKRSGRNKGETVATKGVDLRRVMAENRELMKNVDQLKLIEELSAGKGSST